MCKFLSKSGGVPFQPLGDLTRNDPNIKFTDNYIEILTGDPYKGTYIEKLSQRPPNNSTFLKAVLKYIQAKYDIQHILKVYTSKIQYTRIQSTNL